ncbi:MAG: hypothetical protein HZA54_00380, partial [Planctomycetes bacterium]|nr:hypothetical protein [Planctomycetota bacterium]
MGSARWFLAAVLTGAFAVAARPALADDGGPAEPAAPPAATATDKPPAPPAEKPAAAAPAPAASHDPAPPETS